MIIRNSIYSLKGGLFLGRHCEERSNDVIYNVNLE
jgi:hypothetical protein